MKDYTLHHYDKEKLRQAAQYLFDIDMDQDSDLEQVSDREVCTWRA